MGSWRVHCFKSPTFGQPDFKLLGSESEVSVIPLVTDFSSKLAYLQSDKQLGSWNSLGGHLHHKSNCLVTCFISDGLPNSLPQQGLHTLVSKPFLKTV